MHIGLIGAGGMGRRMGCNLLDAGHRLAVAEPYPVDLDALISAGARLLANPREAAQDADAVVVMVRDDPQLRSAADGEDGFIAGVREGAVVICCSTVSPKQVEALAAPVAERGALLLDCPVSGGVSGAQAGTLTLMIAGSAAAKNAAGPVLKAVGERIYDCGERPGQGQTMKMLVQLLVSAHMAAAAEAFVLARKGGLDLDLVYQVMTNSNATSKMFAEKFPLMMNDDFAPRGALAIQYKDIQIIHGAADSMQVPLPLMASIHQLFQWGRNMGFGELDAAAVVKVWDALDTPKS